MKFVLFLVALLLIPGSAAGLWAALQQFYTQEQVFYPFLAGFVLGLPVYWYLIRRVSWLNTFEHEFTHAVVALLFFRRVSNFKVTMRRGGYITYSSGFGGKTGDAFILLAPYFLPTVTLILVVVRLFIPPEWFMWYYALTGASLAYHLLSNVDELVRNWSAGKFLNSDGTGIVESDISKAGYFFSVVFIFGMGAFILGMLFAVLAGGSSGALTYLYTVWVSAGDALYALGQRAFTLLPK